LEITLHTLYEFFRNRYTSLPEIVYLPYILINYFFDYTNIILGFWGGAGEEVGVGGGAAGFSFFTYFLFGFTSAVCEASSALYCFIVSGLSSGSCCGVGLTGFALYRDVSSVTSSLTGAGAGVSMLVILYYVVVESLNQFYEMCLVHE
jgi:hypothetical protein